MIHLPTWPGWETVRMLGSGTCGTVYEIRPTGDTAGTRAAMKVIRVPQSEQDLRPYLDSGCDPAAIQAIFRRQADEIVSCMRAATPLGDCPHAAVVQEHKIVAQESGLGWEILLRMPLLTPATEYFVSHGMTEQSICRLGTELCDALDAAAAHGIRHGNIKPQNIFVNDQGAFVLSDFGTATAAEILTCKANSDTLGFMAPEVYHAERTAANADIYSLGLVLYWLLNDCHLPFLTKGASDAEAVAQAQELRFRAQPLPLPEHGRESVKYTVLAACEYDPAVRFTSAKAFRTALRNCMQPVAAAVPPVPVAAPMPAPPPYTPPAPAAAPAAVVPPVSAAPSPYAPPASAPFDPITQACDPQDLTAVFAAQPDPYTAPVHSAPFAPAPHVGADGTTYHPDEPYKEEKKVSVGLIVTLVVLILLILGVIAFFVFDAIGSSDSGKDEESSEQGSEKDKEENNNSASKDKDTTVSGEQHTAQKAPDADSKSSEDEKAKPDEEEIPEEDPETEEPEEEPEEETEEESEEETPEEELPEEEEPEETPEEEDPPSGTHPAGTVEYNGHYYYVYDSSAAGNWDDAKLFCEQQGGYLAVVSSKEEDQFLYDLLSRSGLKNAYFGYTDLNTEGSWHWVGSESSSYTNWYPGEPNNYADTEHYAMYYLGYTDGSWNDDTGLMYAVDSSSISVAAISASSELNEDGLIHAAARAIDGSTQTTWTEGANGQGINETLTLTFSGQNNIVGFTIHAGYHASEHLYDVNSRPSTIELTFSDGTVANFQLADHHGSQTIYFSRPVKASSVTIKIKDVYEGSQWEDTAISEISFLSGTLNTGFICEWDS